MDNKSYDNQTIPPVVHNFWLRQEKLTKSFLQRYITFYLQQPNQTKWLEKNVACCQQNVLLDAY